MFLTVSPCEERVRLQELLMKKATTHEDVWSLRQAG